MTQGTIGILFVLLFTPLCSFAGPPVLTDDTGTPGDKHWEINVGLSGEKRTTETRYEGHFVDINYGVGERTQLKYEAPWVFLNSADEGSKNGLGNSTVGVKWRFLDEDKDGIAMSVYPQIEFNNPTSSANRGIADKGNVYFLLLQSEKKIGQVNVNLELGPAFQQYREDAWVYGLVFGHKFRENFEGLAEVNGNATKNFREHRTVCNFGFRLDFSEKYGVQASAGRSFHDAPDQPDFIFYAGVQFRL